MSFHDRLAEAALRDGNTPEQFRAAAQKHANAFWFLVAVGAAVWYFAGWGWSLIPFSLAALTAIQSVSSALTARKVGHLMPYTATPSVAPALPPQIDLEDILHVAIIQEIRQKYGALLSDNSHPYAGCMYRPASLLPYPKATIRRALQALLDFVECRRESKFLDSALRTSEIAATLRTALVSLDDFLDVPAANLPTDARQNLLVGSRLSGK